MCSLLSEISWLFSPLPLYSAFSFLVFVVPALLYFDCTLSPPRGVVCWKEALAGLLWGFRGASHGPLAFTHCQTEQTPARFRCYSHTVQHAFQRTLAGSLGILLFSHLSNAPLPPSASLCTDTDYHAGLGPLVVCSDSLVVWGLWGWLNFQLHCKGFPWVLGFTTQLLLLFL